MLYIVEDTRVRINDKAISASQGGVAAYVAGFINYLLECHTEFGLIGNFEIKDKSGKNTFLSHPKSNLSFLQFLIKLFLVKKFDQQAVFYFQRPDHLACAAGIKNTLILHLHGQQRTNILLTRNILTKFTYFVLERIAMHRATLILATDKTTASIYIKQYPFIARKVKVVPTGIDLAFYSRPPSPPLPPNPTPQKHLIYIGRLAPPKLLVEILNAFHLVIHTETTLNAHPPPLRAERGPGGEVSSGVEASPKGEVSHFTLAGTGSLLPLLQRTVTELGLESHVTFAGFLTKTQVRDLIHQSDAAILLSAHEGSPISIKEILACGKPVVVNDVGDLSEYVIPGKNGYIVNAANPHEVATAILSAFASSGAMREACLSSMKPYDESLINPQIVKLILDCKPAL